MRWLTLLLLVPLVQAGAVSLDDASGDLAYEGPVRLPAPYWPPADIASAAVEENATGFTFTVTGQAFDDRGAPAVHHTTYFVHVEHKQQPYRLEMWRWWPVQAMATGEPAKQGLFHTIDRTTGEVLETKEVPVVSDEAAASLSMHVLRGWLADETGAAPFAGRELAILHVESEATSVPLTQALDFFIDAPDSRITDRLPDAGTWPEPLVVEAGGSSSTGVRLGSPDPFRLSNGEATTFLYSLNLRNDRPKAVDLVLGSAGAPPGWDIQFPEPALHLEPESLHETAVAVRVPFAHQHGGRQEFRVEARQGSDVVAQTLIGIQYTEVPQPSGHHPVLHVHALPASDGMPEFAGTRFLDRGRPFMSTLEDDPDDTGEPLEVLGSVWVPLRPSLAMGLHLSEAEGRLVLRFASDVDVDDVELSGAFVLVDGDGTVRPLLQVVDESTTPIRRGQAVDIEARLVPEMARVPYQRDTQLALDLGVRSVYPGRDIMGDLLWLERGTATLPLREYADAVSEIFTTMSRISISAPVQEKAVNPGSTTLFEVRLENTGAQAARPTLSLSGLGAEWARIVGRAGELPPGESAEVQVAVQPPASAAAGQRTDLLLQAHVDGRLAGLIRLVATVTAEPVPDEAHLLEAPETKRSPAVLGLVAAGIALWIRRR